MQTAADIMTTNVISVNPETEILRAVQLLLENRINGLPVIDDQGRLVGIVCQSDLIVQQKRVRVPSLFTLLDGYISLSSARHFEREVEKIAASQVRQAMTPNPASIAPETPVEEVATLMVEKNYHTLPVVSDGRLVGIVGKEDMLRTIMQEK
ncbi:MAG: CBS domain-containing protein [Desulfobacterales bacterium]|nr:CBS domain-containing protein [Desulfobacterales bacterium]MDJ0874034.1 CBS domain-containing protein [Desulfobacterales bacterium]MDJ0883987.1 CBS domain-containing protein [Desulfobacterales bacterium]